VLTSGQKNQDMTLLLDEGSTDLSNWMREHKAQYALYAEYKMVEDLRVKLHQLAAEILDIQNSGADSLAMEQEVTRLTQLSAQVIAALSALEVVATQPVA